jgi:hypothetical protein
MRIRNSAQPELAHLGDEVILKVQGGLPRAEGLTATPRASRLTAHPLVNGPVLSVPAPVPAQRWVGRCHKCHTVCIRESGNDLRTKFVRYNLLSMVVPSTVYSM